MKMWVTNFNSEHRKLLLAVLKLRHKGFVMEAKNSGFECDGMEFDQYDTPFAEYVALIKNGDVLGCARLTRTDTPYMTQNLYGNQIPEKLLPQNKDVYDLTKMYVDSAIQPFTTRSKLVRIILAYTYISLAKMGAKEFCVTTFPSVADMFLKIGFKIEIVCDLQICGYENAKYYRVIIDLNNCDNVEKIMNNMISDLKNEDAQ